MPVPLGVEPTEGSRLLAGFRNLDFSNTKNQKSFSEILGQAVERANARVTDANEAVVDLATGKAASTHEVMIKVEEAHLALQWTVQLRNRALEAYQEIMRMPL